MVNKYVRVQHVLCEGVLQNASGHITAAISDVCSHFHDLMSHEVMSSDGVDIMCTRRDRERETERERQRERQIDRDSDVCVSDGCMACES
jgi:hypothetical protein